MSDIVRQSGRNGSGKVLGNYLQRHRDTEKTRREECLTG